jgi:hypothetical protein
MKIFIGVVLVSITLFGEGIFKKENREDFYKKNHIFIGWLEKSYSYDEIRAYGEYIEAVYPNDKENYIEYIDYLSFLDFEERVLKKEKK